MSALSQTAANFAPSANAVYSPFYPLGATGLTGQAVYLDATNQTLKLAGAASTAAVAGAVGFLEAGGATGQLRRYVIKDPALVPGFTATAGFPIQLHTTAGSFTQTQADIGSGNYGVSFGSMTSTTVLNFTGVSVGSALA